MTYTGAYSFGWLVVTMIQCSHRPRALMRFPVSCSSKDKTGALDSPQAAGVGSTLGPE